MAEPTSMKLGTPVVVAMTASSVQSAAIGAANPGQTGAYTTVRFATLVDMWCAVGLDPTAAANTNGSFPLPAGSVEYFDIPFGHKVAGIAASGSLSLTPMSKS